MSNVSNDDSFICDEDPGAPYDPANCYNIFTHNIKFSRKPAGEEPAAQPSQPMSENCLFDILSNMALNVTNLHIRFEDDYFSQAVPFAFGIVCEGLTSYRVGNEWRFGAIENSRFVRSNPRFELLD